jgi:hypothetical protein
MPFTGKVRTKTHLDDYPVYQDLTGTIAAVPRFRTLESAMRSLLHFRHFFIGVAAIASALQWSIVVERTWAAIWACYKFTGYGGGHIVVGRRIQVLFLLGSCVLACICYALSRAERKAVGAGVWERLAQLVWVSIAVCTLFWFVLLLTPLVAFTQ